MIVTVNVELIFTVGRLVSIKKTEADRFSCFYTVQLCDGWAYTSVTEKWPY